MTVRRIVANLPVADPALDAPFWVGVLGCETAMDLGGIVNHRVDDTIQVQLVRRDASAPQDSAVSVEVGDLDELAGVHAAVVDAGYAIVHPMTDEPWGVRRFLVRTPGGTVVNVLAHR